MKDIYEECPELQNEDYLLRLLKKEDANDLLKVYSDKKALPLFNSDNCNGNDFYNDTLEGMAEAIKWWLWSYEHREFVRFSIVHKQAKEVVGTIECYQRLFEDSFNHCGIMRLDLRSDLEQSGEIEKILRPFLSKAYVLFDCECIATKVIPEVAERRKALELLGFAPSKGMLVGNDGTKYGHYWVRENTDED